MRSRGCGCGYEWVWHGRAVLLGQGWTTRWPGSSCAEDTPLTIYIAAAVSNFNCYCCAFVVCAQLAWNCRYAGSCQDAFAALANILTLFRSAWPGVPSIIKAMLNPRLKSSLGKQRKCTRKITKLVEHHPLSKIIYTKLGTIFLKKLLCRSEHIVFPLKSLISIKPVLFSVH